jgi:hypothetical protein
MQEIQFERGIEIGSNALSFRLVENKDEDAKRR